MKKPHVKNSVDVLEFINSDKPVRVYRNLHSKCLSVQQDGIVRCHVENVVLKDCEFKVSIKGRDRVRKEGKKNVHAYIKGMVISASETIALLDFGWESCYYSPYSTDWWMLKSDARGQYVDRAGWCDIYADAEVASVMAFDILYKKNQDIESQI